MNNISQKIIILFTAVAIAAAAVLAFIPSIVRPPQELDYENFHKKEIIDNINKFSTSLSYHDNDTTYEGIILRMKIYLDEAYLAHSERDDLLATMVDKYIPVFVALSNEKFSRRVWHKEDHVKMRNRISSLRNLCYIESSAPLLNSNKEAQLTSILRVITDYDDAMNLAKNARFTNVTGAIDQIRRADEYSGSRPLNNCSDLVEKLGQVRSKISISHYKKIETELDNLNNYRDISEADFTSRLSAILQQIEEYRGMSSHYGDAILSTDSLNEQAATIEQVAKEYYSRPQINVYTNGQWELISNGSNNRAYHSTSNYWKNSTDAKMYFTIRGYSSFTFEIGSNSEHGCDYVIVGKNYMPNINNYDYTTKNHSNGYYMEVTYYSLDPAETYTIHVVYRKDSSQHQEPDRGYLRLPNPTN